MNAEGALSAFFIVQQQGSGVPDRNLWLLVGSGSYFGRGSERNLRPSRLRRLLRFPKFLCALERHGNFDRCAILALLHRPPDALRRWCPKQICFDRRKRKVAIFQLLRFMCLQLNLATSRLSLIVLQQGIKHSKESVKGFISAPSILFKYHSKFFCKNNNNYLIVVIRNAIFIL